MAPGGLTCPDCGSSNVIDDDLYSQRQMVCEDCGSVVEEGALVTTDREGTDISYSRSTAVDKDKQPCLNQRAGMQRVKALCRILRMNSEIEETALMYYQQAYQHPNFIRLSLHKKEALGGCCVLVSCQQRSWPIAIGSIIRVLEADPIVVVAVYKELVKTLSIEAPPASITDVLEAHCQEYKVSPGDVPEELAEDPKDLAKRAVALAELAADLWLVTGRRPQSIMMASIYLAWQSLKPTKMRLKYTLDRFCKLAKVSPYRPALKRIPEIKEALCKLGQEIPWVGENLTPDRVMLQVGDIVTYRHALLQRALRTHDDALMEEPHPGCEDAAPSQTSGLGTQTANKSCGETSEPKAESAEPPRGGDLSSVPGLDTGCHWGKRTLFAPPCVKNPKIRRVEREVLQDVTGDEEISDSEIDMYIRTPQEVRDFARAKNKLRSAEEGEEQEG